MILWMPSSSCPPGLVLTNWGCERPAPTLGETTTRSRNAVWVGVIGLGLAATIMIAMGFHKPVQPVRRRRT
jgi:hypothetical protein